MINKEEWLDVIKDKCKQRAKTHFWVGLVLLILLLMYFLIWVTMAIDYNHFTHYSDNNFDGFVYVCLLTSFLLALMSGLYALKSHSILKTIEGLGTPEQLLNKFKKYVKDKNIFWTIGELIFCGYLAWFLYTSDMGIIVKVMLWIFILVAATLNIYKLIRGEYMVGSSDLDITRRLQELIGEQ